MCETYKSPRNGQVNFLKVQRIYRSRVGKRALPIMCANYTRLLTTVFSVSVILVWMHVKYLKIKDEIQCL